MFNSTMKSKVVCAAACLFFLCSTRLFSSSIESINIVGLKRMKRDAVLEILPVEAGDAVYDGIEEDIRIALADTDLFIDPKVEIIDGPDENVAVTLHLEEKWTLIPMPFFMYSNGSIGGGMFLFDSNFRGKRQLIVGGFTYSEDEKLFLFMLKDPKIGKSKYGLGMTLKFDDQLGGPGKMSAAGRAEYNFNRETILSAGLRGSLGREASLFGSGEFRPLVQLETSLERDSTVPGMYFPKGFTGEITYAPGLMTDTGSMTQEFEAEAGYAWLPAPSHQFEFTARGEYAVLPDIFAEGHGGRKGARTLPNDEVFSGMLASADASYQYAAWSSRTFTGALTVFGETGFYADDTFTSGGDLTDGLGMNDMNYYYGFGGGFRLYLKRVAIPAMGLDVGYNMVDRDVQVSFSIGMGM